MTGPGNDAGDAGARPVEEMSYAQASAELDEIVRYFEQRDLDVDQLVGRLVRATAIVEELDRRLRRTRLQVEQLVPRLAAVLSDGEPEDAGPDRDVTAGAGPARGAEAAEAPSTSDPETPPGEGGGSGAALF